MSTTASFRLSKLAIASEAVFSSAHVAAISSVRVSIRSAQRAGIRRGDVTPGKFDAPSAATPAFSMSHILTLLRLECSRSQFSWHLIDAFRPA